MLFLHAHFHSLPASYTVHAVYTHSHPEAAACLGSQKLADWLTVYQCEPVRSSTGPVPLHAFPAALMIEITV